VSVAVVATLLVAVQAIRIAVPYVLAALGGVLGERSGVVDLALEAKLLVGAFAAAWAARASDSIAVGIAAGALGGVLVALIHASATLIGRADQIVVGIALNLAAAGGTRYALAIMYGQSANSRECPSLGGAVWGDPLVWLAALAAIGVSVLLARTAFGVRIRAAGDRPAALRAAGVSVLVTRWRAIILGGALAGAGGAELSLQIGGFSTEMSGGRGYIALAAVILAGWRPARAVLFACGFALVKALSIRLQLRTTLIPAELIELLPYVVCLLALIFARGQLRPPAALGKPDDDQ